MDESMSEPRPLHETLGPCPPEDIAALLRWIDGESPPETDTPTTQEPTK